MTKATEVALKIIRDSYGDGSIMRLSDKPTGNVPVISTGCLSFDLATGVGGLPCGRVSEIYGPAGAGKSSVALHLVAEAQRAGKQAAYIDVEHSFSVSYAMTLGVNPDLLFISQPDDAESALEISELLIRSGDFGIVIIDSVDALVPKAVIEGEHGDRHVALLARLMSQGLRKLTGVVAKANTCLLFINQERQGIPIGGYGPTSFTSGGVALKYYTTMRIEIKRIAALKDKDERVIGNRTKIKIVKNKVAVPFKECEFDLIFGYGIDKNADLLDLGIAHKIIDRSGSWYSLSTDGTKLGQGRQAALAFLSENTEMLESIKISILKAKGL